MSKFFWSWLFSHCFSVLVRRMVMGFDLTGNIQTRISAFQKKRARACLFAILGFDKTDLQRVFTYVTQPI